MKASLPITIRLPVVLKRRLSDYAKASGMSMRGVVITALTTYLDRKELIAKRIEDASRRLEGIMHGTDHEDNPL